MSTSAMTDVQYRITGMDCSACAAKIEAATRDVAGVTSVKVSIASQLMTLAVANTPVLPNVERTVTDLGYQLSRVDEADSDGSRSTHLQSGYKRALWTVILLNAGYGAIEIVGGFIAGSQAVKADALDFIGDGLISFLGLIAIAWGLAARARAALLQGVFLAVLGIAVLANTVYRVFIVSQPEAELMGLFVAIALVVNIAAAAVLMPHRKGDANVRAVWLFSRNDAIGNAAVVAAAALVWWTHSPWPDLIVAIVIAGLFLHSAWSIIRDATSDLAHARKGPPQ